jgi:hypothetical protein
MKGVILTLLATQVAASGCQVCTTELREGIRVTILDAETRGRVEEVVTVIVTDGSYSETVNLPVTGIPIATLAVERPGTYRVEVRATGYVETIQLTAELERSEAG